MLRAMRELRGHGIASAPHRGWAIPAGVELARAEPAMAEGQRTTTARKALEPTRRYVESGQANLAPLHHFYRLDLTGADVRVAEATARFVGRVGPAAQGRRNRRHHRRRARGGGRGTPRLLRASPAR
jgi:hypothetical protein